LVVPVEVPPVSKIGLDTSNGIEVDANVTRLPATTGFGAQSKSAAGRARATPDPSGNTTARRLPAPRP
jgi:hypothetical protein